MNGAKKVGIQLVKNFVSATGRGTDLDLINMGVVRNSYRHRLSLLVAASISVLVLTFAWHNWLQVGQFVSSALSLSTGFDDYTDVPLCAQLLGAKDVLLVLKTGANEVADKLNVHLRTTLTCYPYQVIFSDYEEYLYTGHHLYDAFSNTSLSIKKAHKDFDLWRRLQAGGRAGLSPSALSGTDSREKDEDIRKEIPGWQLDKWKFLPMVNQTLYLYPNKDWYVFVEADTYLLWSNLLLYVARRSWTEDHYIGSRAVIEELDFAHGGSGFLLSRPALEKVVKLFKSHQEEWETFTERYWVGDHILAAALREAGVLLQDGRPTWQGKPASLLDFRPEGDLWCSTAMTFHHQSPTEIKDLWEFEQAWISETLPFMDTEQSRILRYRDLFEHFILPQIREIRSNWNNMAELPEISARKSLHDCEAICEQDSHCMQYAFHSDGTCMTTSKLMLGDVSDHEVTSG